MQYICDPLLNLNFSARTLFRSGGEGRDFYINSALIPTNFISLQNVHKYMATTPIGFDMKEHLLALLKEKFANVEGVRWYAAATLLDPRFKKLGFTQDDMRSPIRIAEAISFVGKYVYREFPRVLINIPSIHY